MTTAILAPWAKDEVTRLGQQTFKKQILRFGKIVTDDGEFDFTPEFGQQMVEAFQTGVMPTVPLVLAGDDNSHTQAVDRQGGEVIGLELSNEGLNGYVRANDDTAKLINENPRMGVSIRALQGRLDNDGKRWPAVLHHVLATFDPVVGGMGNWEPIELSNDVTKVINLANPAGSTDGGTDSMAKKSIADALSTEDAEQLYSLLGKALGRDGNDDGKATEVDDQQPETDTASETEDDDLDLTKLTDEELEALLLEEDGQSENPAPVKGEVVDQGKVVETESEDEDADDHEREPVAASRGGGDVLELSNARLKEQAVELSRMRAELDASNYEKERDQLVRQTGLPPRVIDLARPLLEGAGRTVELSNGKKTDAGKVVREVLGEVGRTLKALDLSNPAGFAIGDEGDDDDQSEDRAEFINRVKKEFRLGS